MASKPNPNWPRWIKSSIIEHFQVNVADVLGLPFLAEGVHVRDTAFMESEDRAEIRIWGPTTQENSANCWKLEVEINIHITSTIGGNTKDVYTLERNAGKFLEYANTSINIYRFGTGGDDDDTLLGCLSPRTRKNDSVKYIPFGQINPTDTLLQAQVDGKYEMELNT